MAHYPTIEAINLARSLPFAGGMITVLQDVSFQVQPGEWIALMGPSGSGKSTLLGLIAGLDRPSAGRIRVDGVEIAHLGERALARVRAERIGMVFQSYHLIPGLTAEENVALPQYASRRAQDRERAAELLDLVGLADRRHHRPSQLSGGQQQRIALARALVNQPSLLVADEPTGNLDQTNGALVLDLLAQLRQTFGLTLVVATHDPAVAARADRVLRLADGRLVGTAQPAGGR